MNGTKPRFMENLVIAPSYYEQPDPYVNAPSCHVNLLELSRYAKKSKKKEIPAYSWRPFYGAGIGNAVW